MTLTPVSSPPPVEVLILGAGWTSTFLLPLLARKQISHAATTTSGRDNTIPFTFDPSSSSTTPYKLLPSAKTVLITFPLTGTEQSKQLTGLYRDVHGVENRFIQLGSTGIYKSTTGWTDRNSDYDRSGARVIAEDELLSLPNTCVLNLSGLYGGARQPRNWLTRIFKAKEDVRKKGCVHMVHGDDVARAILGCHENWTKVSGGRWIITDLRVYDWWDLGMSWGGEAAETLKGGACGSSASHGSVERAAVADGKEEIVRLEHAVQVAKWVGECMREEGVRALPRDSDLLGRRLDARDFWEVIGAWPSAGRLG